MKDRISNKPGGVRFISDDGSVDVRGTLYMDDEPIEEGTLLTKDTLLADNTAASLGLDLENGTVNDALAALDAKIVVVSGTYIGDQPNENHAPVAREINIGMPVKAVLIVMDGSSEFEHIQSSLDQSLYGGFAVEEGPVTFGPANTVAISVSSTGFTVSDWMDPQGSNKYISSVLNRKGHTYHYVAFL